LKLDNKSASVCYNRARSKCKINKTNECLGDLKMAIELDEKYVDLANKDKDFDSIKDNGEFKLLISR
jgi:hypothetical protein